MKISTKGLYAVRFMVFLAGHGGTEPVPLKEIAEATSISRKYLEQVAQAPESTGPRAAEEQLGGGAAGS